MSQLRLFMVTIKSKEEIEKMRRSGQLAAKTLQYIRPHLKPGVSTETINQLCHKFIINNGAIPAPLNYKGFPKSICTSINEVVCHGIPSKAEVLQNGDILNIDVTTILEGYHGDTNKTYFIGEVSEEAQKLVTTTYECMMAGIAEVKPNNRLGDIGHAIQTVAEARGYSVVRDFCGHGIGLGFHEDPQVPHYGKAGQGMRLKPGMTFTIEPMINLGGYEVEILDDDWTAVTIDGKLSAQFEHTILVTSEGHEILTWLDEGDLPI